MLSLQYFLKKANLLAIAKLTNRAVADDDTINMDPLVVREYVYKVLTVPAYVYYVESLCPEVREQAVSLSVMALLLRYTVIIRN